MVVNESEALRWVTRQWQRLNGKDKISGVGGMLWEFRSVTWMVTNCCGDRWVWVSSFSPCFDVCACAL